MGHLHRFFPDWTPLILGIEEKYKHSNYTIYFPEPRPDQHGTNPSFIFQIENVLTDNMVYSERIMLDEMRNNRETLMLRLRNKVTELTGIIIPPPIPLP